MGEGEIAARMHHLGGKPDGNKVVFIHGFGADRMSWLATAPALFGDYDVWAVDLPGHGAASAAVGDGSVGTLAAAVGAALDQSVGAPAVLVGHSLGGAIALDLASERQDIRGLFLIAPAGVSGKVNVQFLKDLPDVRDETEALEVLHRLVLRPRLISPNMAQYLLAHLEKPGRRDALRQIADGLSKQDGQANAWQGDLAIPSMIVHGEQDAICRVHASMLDMLDLIPDCGHMPHVERVALVGSKLKNLLKTAFPSVLA